MPKYKYLKTELDAAVVGWECAAAQPVLCHRSMKPTLLSALLVGGGRTNFLPQKSCLD